MFNQKEYMKKYHKQYYQKNGNKKKIWREQHKKPCPKCGKFIHSVSSLCRSCANRITMLGTKRNPYKIRIDKGLPHRKEWNEKVAESQRGEKSYNWKGGITPLNKKSRNSIEFRLWREAVFARDNWTCQKCKNKGGKIHPHHIKNFAIYIELRFAIDNGITLCIDCHKEFHKKYGKYKNNENQLEEFLK